MLQLVTTPSRDFAIQFKIDLACKSQREQYENQVENGETWKGLHSEE